jgi:hypothetical protein
MVDPGRTNDRITSPLGSGWRIRISWLPGKGVSLRTYKLDEAEYSLCREPAEGVIHVPDQAVSQGKVVLSGGPQSGYKLTDLGARNGVRVNGKVVKAKQLESGDVIRVGDSLLVYDRTAPSILDTPTKQSSPDRQQFLDAVFCAESSSGHQLNLDCEFLSKAQKVVVVVGEGHVETRAAAEWIAARANSKLVVIDASARSADKSIRTAPADATILVDALQDLRDQRRVVVGEAIAERSRVTQKQLVISYVSHDLQIQPQHRRLFTGLQAAQLNIPPVHRRPTDVLNALASLVKDLKFPFESTPVDLIECLLCYDWPGGVEEVRGMLERVRSALEAGAPLKTLPFPEEVRGFPLEYLESGKHKFTLEAVQRVFSDEEGSVKSTAARFNVSRQHFYEQLRNAGIDIKELRQNLADAKPRETKRKSSKGPK